MCAFLQGTDNGVSEKLLYGFLSEIRMGRADDGNTFLVCPYEETGKFSRFQMKTETWSFNAEVQIQRLGRHLLPSLQQAGTVFLDDRKHLDGQTSGRNGDMKPVGFGAHADVPRRASGADNYLTEIRVGNHSLGCHEKMKRFFRKLLAFPRKRFRLLPCGESLGFLSCSN